jgi:hypothetical protein
MQKSAGWNFSNDPGNMDEIFIRKLFAGLFAPDRENPGL